MSEFIIEEAPKDLAEDFAEFFEGSADIDRFVAGGLLRNYFEWLNNNKKDKLEESLLHFGDTEPSSMSVLQQPFNAAPMTPMMYLGKDVDVFFKDRQSFDNFTKGSSSVHFEKTYETDNSVGYQAFYSPHVLNLDCVRKNYGTPEEILKGFDQVVTQAALFKSDGTNGLVKDKIYIMLHPRFREAVANRRMLLNYGRNNYNYHILERTLRYIKYGYLPDETTSRKIIDSFLSNHPALSNSFTAQDFVQEFGKKRLKDLLQKKSSRIITESCDEDTKKRMIDKSVGQYANALYCFLVDNNNNISVGLGNGPSMSSNSTVERSYVRIAKNYMGDKYLNDPLTRRNAYRQTVKDLKLPAILKERLNITHDIVRFHQFLADKREIIGEDMVEFFVDFAHSRFVTRSAQDNSRSVIHCTVCDNSEHGFEDPMPAVEYSKKPNKSSWFSTDEGFSEETHGALVEVVDYKKMVMSDTRRHMNEYETGYYASDDWTEIIHESFLKNPDDNEWLKKTAAFYKEALTFCGEELPNIEAWHTMLDNNGFDPDIPPSLLLTLFA